MIGPNPANRRRHTGDEIADFSASFFIKCNAPFPRFLARTALAFEETFLLNAGEEIRAIHITEGCTLTDKELQAFLRRKVAGGVAESSSTCFPCFKFVDDGET